jgi:hypothetical protein
VWNREVEDSRQGTASSVPKTAEKSVRPKAAKGHGESLHRLCAQCLEILEALKQPNAGGSYQQHDR